MRHNLPEERRCDPGVDWNVQPGRARQLGAGEQLHSLGLEPRIEVVVQSFLALPSFVIGTERLGLVQSAVAAQVADMPGIRVFEPPFEAVPVVNALW